MPEIVVRLQELPGIEIVVRTSFWRGATILQAGKPLQRASGRRGPYVLPMPDGTQRTIKVVGTLNSSVVIDGRTYPIERRLRPYEYLLAAIPLVLAIPGFTGGALGFALGFGGVFANARLARSSARLPLRLLIMTGTSVLLLAIYIGVSIALVAALHPGGTGPTLAVGDCFDGALTATTADKFTAVACNGVHDAEVVGRPAYAPAASAFPGQGALDTFAATACPAAFATYVGRPFDPAKDGMTYYSPTSDGWDAGGRELVCLVVAPSGQKFTGPIAGH